jgi:hypothetical protein
LTGSLQVVSGNVPYLVSGINTIITTGTNGQVVISVPTVGTYSGAGGGYYSTSFNDINLVSSVLYVNHGLGTQYVNVDVWDNNNEKVIPNYVKATNANSVDIGLASFAPIAGTWHVSVAAGVSITSASYSFSGTLWATGTWDDRGQSLVTSGSVNIDGQYRNIDAVGYDLFFFVSGTTGTGPYNNKKSAFGGDLVVTGTLTVGTGSQLKLTSNDVQLGGWSTRIEKSGSTMKFFDPGTTSGYTLAQLASVSDVNPTFLTLTPTASIPNQRTLVLSSGLSGTDGGPGGNYQLFVLDSVFAALTGANFTGPVKFNGGLSGSLQTLANGLQYLKAGPNVTIVTGANGQITISATGSGGGGGTTIVGTGGDPSASYVVLGVTSSLANERVLTMGTGLSSSDGGPSGIYVVSIRNNIVATLTGANFTGPVKFGGGLSGSLQQTTAGIPYLIGGTNIEVTTGSNGQITITNTMPGGSGGDPYPSYLVLTTTASLANDRAFVAGTGLSSTDGGAGGNYTLAINNAVVATLTGSTFSGPVRAAGGLSGSLQQLTSGIPYLVGGGIITVQTSANGQVVVSSSSPAAENNASYLVLSGTASLSSERVFTVGTGLLGTDAGANSTYTLGVNNAVVATLSGANFTGPVKFNSGLSGSLQQLASGIPYLVAGSNVSIATGSNGQVTISSVTGSGGSGADPGASYLVIATTSSLSNERTITMGTGLQATDAGANSNYTISIRNNIVATVSGTAFTGPVKADGGLSGSLQQISAGLPYLIGGTNVSVTTSSNGQVVVSAAALAGADPYPSYLLLSATSSLYNERALTLGTGLTGSDAGPGGNYTIVADNSVLATLSGSTFSGPVFAAGGLTGSLQQISAGVPYLVAGPNITINTSSNGQISITGSAAGSGGADPDATYLVLTSTSSLSSERVLTMGTGLTSSDGGANGSFTVSVLNSVVATLTGANFTGPVSFTSGLTGSLQLLSSGLPYIVGSGSITVTTSSNGQIVVGYLDVDSGSAGTSGEISASYLVLSATSSLANERVFAVGTGLTSSDGGAGGSFTVSVNNAVVATLTGSVFTGPAVFNGGMTGSLQQVSAGVPYIVAGPNIIINTSSAGQISITGSATGTGGGDPSAAYLVLSTTASLDNERVLAVGTGLTSSDGGPNGSFTVSVLDSVVATVSGTIFTGRVYASAGLTGSLQEAAPGLPFLVAGPNITINTASNGQVSITGSAAGAGGGDPNASYLVLAGTASLSSERVFTVGTGLTSSDAGANGSFTVSVLNSVVATLSGANFTGPVQFLGGLSGSLQQLTSGIPYLVGSGSVTVTTGASGQITISSTAPTSSLSVTGLASGSVVFVGSSSNLTGSTPDLYWDNTAKRLGVGTQAPGFKLEVSGDFAATTKSFVIDHPTKPGWKLRHGSLEGPENGVYIRGEVTDSNIIRFPEYWQKLVDPASVTVTLTPVGRWQKLFVQEITSEEIVVGCASRDKDSRKGRLSFHYVVQAARIDAPLKTEYDPRGVS